MGRLQIVPSRLVLIVTWLVAVVLATGLGLIAVNSVGGTASGRGPVGPDTIVVAGPSGPSGPPAAQPGRSVITREFRYDFGTFTVSCKGPYARVLGTAAAPGWKTLRFEPGPDDDLVIVFSDPKYLIEVEVFCNRGMPQVSDLDRGLITGP